MSNIVLWEPIYPPEKKEPHAELKYGDVVFEISYSLMNMRSGWLACGMAGSFAPANACKKTAKAITYLESVMGYDATLVSEEDKIYYKGFGIPCDRPKLKREDFL